MALLPLLLRISFAEGALAVQNSPAFCSKLFSSVL